MASLTPPSIPTSVVVVVVVVVMAAIRAIFRPPPLLFFFADQKPKRRERASFFFFFFFRSENSSVRFHYAGKVLSDRDRSIVTVYVSLVKSLFCLLCAKEKKPTFSFALNVPLFCVFSRALIPGTPGRERERERERPGGGAHNSIAAATARGRGGSGGGTERDPKGRRGGAPWCSPTRPACRRKRGGKRRA